MTIPATHRGLQTIGDFSVEEVLSHVPSPKDKPVSSYKIFSVNGVDYEVRMTSKRLLTFKKSLQCVCCGVAGVKFKLEVYNGHKNPHFNLYAVESNGLEVLMTRDHIKPRGLGGSDSVDNLQTMCTVCNHLKGVSIVPMEYVKKRKEDWLRNRGAYVHRDHKPQCRLLGYRLLQIVPTESGTRTTTKEARLFLGPDIETVKKEIKEYLSATPIDWRVIDVNNRLRGVYPIFKLCPVRAKKYYAWQEPWETKEPHLRDLALAYEVMGWQLIYEENKQCWWKGGQEVIPKIAWSPTSFEADAKEMEERVRGLGLFEKYAAALAGLEAPTLMNRCDAAWAVVKDAGLFPK